MSEIKCFKIKPGTDYDRAVKQFFVTRPKWTLVYEKVSELLGEKITRMAHSVDTLRIDLSELKNEENKKLFKKDGCIKGNLKQSKEVLKKYKDILLECGLSEYKDLSYVNFAYGVMRLKGQELEQFATSKGDLYFKANFDLEKRVKDLVIPITEIEYQESYLEELKKDEAKLAR